MMTDREKIIKWLRDIQKCCAMGAGTKGNYIRTVDKAIDLLKEQDAKIKSLERTIEDICCGGRR